MPAEGVDAYVEEDLARLVRRVRSTSDSLPALRGAALSTCPDDALVQWLYEQWYLLPDDAAPPDPRMAHHANLPGVFHAALPGSTKLTAGWTVLAIGRDGACVAGRRGLAREVRCGEYANISRPGVPVMPGDGIAIADCIDVVDWSTGFWATRSSDGEPAAPMVRLYWSVPVCNIASVLSDVIVALEKTGVRYSLKCPVRSADFVRVDSLVMYLEHACWLDVRDRIVAVARSCEGRLRPRWPPLTLRLSTGVAFAEDPPGDLSFGQSRCQALAPGVAALLEAAPLSLEHGTSVLRQALRRAGIDPNRPWVNACD